MTTTETTTNSTFLHSLVESSSTIASVGYDLLMGNLLVEFKNGSKYEYVNVPKEVYDNMIEAESVGKFFAKNVKGNYGFLRVA